MIDREKITLEWIEKVSAAHRNADKILVEKAIRAFLLLEGLAKEGIPFVFKGGTSLMLHFPVPGRLSIDIDIIIPGNLGDLETRLDTIAVSQGFIRREQQQRPVAPAMIKAHHRFFFRPSYRTREDEDYVLLDILSEQVNYGRLIELPIRSAFLPPDDNPLRVSLPSTEDLLGDKLTAFAPNTTGVPYFKNEDRMSMEIIKQLFDIGTLADAVSDINLIRSTFLRFAETELVYRQLPDLTPADVLEDIFQTALSVVSRGTDGKGNFTELQDGIQRIRDFIFSENYHLEKAIVHASKAAWLATLIKYKSVTFERFTSPAQIRDFIITGGVNTKLNRLKKSSPEAFFYWYQIANIINAHAPD